MARLAMKQAAPVKGSRQCANHVNIPVTGAWRWPGPNCCSRGQKRVVVTALSILLFFALLACFLSTLLGSESSHNAAFANLGHGSRDNNGAQSGGVPKTYVTIRGTKHSGTAWLRTLLQDNFVLKRGGPGQDEFGPGHYGWKHGPLQAEDHERLLHEPSHAVVVLLRGALSWLPKMVRQPYSLSFESRFSAATSMQERDSFSCNIRYPWVQRCSSADIGPAAVAHLGCQAGDLLEAAANMVKMRDNKYRWWLALRDTLPRGQVAVVRYEDLVADPRGELARLERELNLVRGRSKETIAGYVKFNRLAELQEVAPPALSALDCAWLRSQLDEGLEAEAGLAPYQRCDPGEYAVVGYEKAPGAAFPLPAECHMQSLVEARKALCNVALDLDPREASEGELAARQLCQQFPAWAADEYEDDSVGDQGDAAS